MLRLYPAVSRGLCFFRFPRPRGRLLRGHPYPPGRHRLGRPPVADMKGHTVLAGLTVGSYIHPRNHTGLFTLVYGELLRPPRAHVRFSVRLMAGYYHTWPDGTLYGFDDGGALVVVPNTGSAHLGVGCDLGWRLSGLSFMGLTPFIRCILMGEYPYNGYLLPHPGISVGLLGTLPGSGVK